MKTLILANNLPWETWDEKIQQLKAWWLPEINLDITLEHTKFSKIPFEKYTNNEGKVSNGISKLWYDENISKPALARGFDCVIFVVEMKQWKGGNTRGWNTYNNLGICEIHMRGQEKEKYSYNGVEYEGGEWFNIARHELSHAIYKSRKIADNTHKWFGVGNLSEVKKELSGGFLGHPMVLAVQRLLVPPTQYRYFNQSEVDGLHPELVKMLDEARHIAGIPFKLNSTLRSPEQNKAVGGKPNSAHLRGLAVDIHAPTSAHKYKIVNSAIQVGFKRIGFGSNFIHLDCDNTLPQEVIWEY